MVKRKNTDIIRTCKIRCMFFSYLEKLSLKEYNKTVMKK